MACEQTTECVKAPQLSGQSAIPTIGMQARAAPAFSASGFAGEHSGSRAYDR